mmetsp:Transcript_12464/g.13812  ORF Transcript_12464/g.13812 Transcript_12464/m.13812 type:complete len:100 (-) Transcript_12464:320-619(-)
MHEEYWWGAREKHLLLLSSSSSSMSMVDTVTVCHRNEDEVLFFFLLPVSSRVSPCVTNSKDSIFSLFRLTISNPDRTEYIIKIIITSSRISFEHSYIKE